MPPPSIRRSTVTPPIETPPPSSMPVEELPPSDPPSVSPVAAWLEQARAYLAEDKLTSPPGENAFELCQRVLAEEPANAAAQALLREIADRYTAWGDAQMARGDPEQALAYYDKSLLVLASDAVAQKRDAAATLIADQQAGQQAVPPEPTPPAQANFEQIATLPAGTEIRVRLLQTLSSANGHKEGDAIDFAVLEDVVVGGAVLISRGARAIGQIVEEQRGRLFQRGELRFTLHQVEAVDGRQIALESDWFGNRGARGEEVTLDEGTVYLARVARSTSIGLR
jgi:tetratricopeptide (TPR) repeat protein